MRWWKCSGAQSACDSNVEFGNPKPLVSSGPTYNPKIIAVPNGSNLDAYVMYEDANITGLGDVNEVHLLANCGAVFSAGAGDWTDVGNLPVPAGYSLTAERTTGVFPGSASSQWYWDGTKMHFAFMVETTDGSTTPFSVADWSAQPGVDVCEQEDTGSP